MFGGATGRFARRRGSGRVPRARGRRRRGRPRCDGSVEHGKARRRQWHRGGARADGGFSIIIIFNHLSVKEGEAGQIVEQFANSRGNVQGFPGFLSMEVLRSEEEDEVLVITRWRDKDAFNSWVHSEEFKKAHGRSGRGGLLRGNPQMSAYEVAV